MNIENYYENSEILHIGCEDNRAYFIPFSDREDALEGIREKSDRFFCSTANGDFITIMMCLSCWRALRIFNMIKYRI